jgi:hypothetical protein
MISIRFLFDSMPRWPTPAEPASAAISEERSRRTLVRQCGR